MEEILKYFKELTPQQVERFAALKGLYDEWNARINVISRKDMDNFYLHHVLHSLAAAKVLQAQIPSQPGMKILDVGTGGGFPGIPLAIFFPQVQFTLCDSIGKKTKVAAAVAQALGLENVTVVNGRAEELKECFDFVVSRAVTSLDKFIPWVKDKYIRSIVYLKGGDIDAELDLCTSRRLLDPKKVLVCEISTFFENEWFEEKKIVVIAR